MAKLPLNFGHRPRRTKRWSRKLYSAYTALFGVSNLIKRQQVYDLFKALDLKEGERVLDFGCSSGYISIEMSRMGAHVTGLDVIDPDLDFSKIMDGKLSYVKYGGDLEEIPLRPRMFDKILASEVTHFTDNTRLFGYLVQLLKDDGKIIVLSGVGRPVIMEAYQRNHWLLRLFRFAPSYYPSYEEYVSSLNNEFHSKDSEFADRLSVLKSLKQNGLQIESQIFTPPDSVVRFLEWYQYVCKTVFGRATYVNNPLLFLVFHPYCSFLARLKPARTLEYGVLITACKKPASV
jgi:SAM-dependent methyltransferase